LPIEDGISEDRSEGAALAAAVAIEKPSIKAAVRRAQVVVMIVSVVD